MCGGDLEEINFLAAEEFGYKNCVLVFSWIPVDTFYAKPINPMNNIKSLPPFKLFKVEYGQIIGRCTKRCFSLSRDRLCLSCRG